MVTKTETITVEWLKSQRACREQVDRFAALYPDGMPVTEENARACHEAGLDVVWAACHLMTEVQRQAFIRFTLAQRQPHVAALFVRAGLDEQAKAIAGLDIEADSLERIREVMAAAKDAAWDAAYTAARDAARDARDAAWDAARDARDAAWDAARDAVWAAAWAAAWDAAEAAQVEWVIRHMVRQQEGE